MNESYTSSITQYQESSVADSVVGFRTQAVFGNRTTGATAVHLVDSIQSQIADFLQMNASVILVVFYKINYSIDLSLYFVIALTFLYASSRFFASTTIHNVGKLKTLSSFVSTFLISSFSGQFLHFLAILID